MKQRSHPIGATTGCGNYKEQHYMHTFTLGWVRREEVSVTVIFLPLAFAVPVATASSVKEPKANFPEN